MALHVGHSLGSPDPHADARKGLGNRLARKCTRTAYPIRFLRTNVGAVTYAKFNVLTTCMQNKLQLGAQAFSKLL